MLNICQSVGTIAARDFISNYQCRPARRNRILSRCAAVDRCVVAGAATELDETALRRALRDHDAILRVPIVGREADYWNAGARDASTPWLLFVEAHGLPAQVGSVILLVLSQRL